jgi:hypothetical protein
MQTIKRTPSIHERSARFAKRVALRRAMDREIRKAGADPDSDPHAVADALAKWPLSDWARFAVAYGIRPPSAITVGELLDDYRKDGGAREVIETTGEVLEQAS